VRKINKTLLHCFLSKISSNLGFEVFRTKIHRKFFLFIAKLIPLVEKWSEIFSTGGPPHSRSQPSIRERVQWKKNLALKKPVFSTFSNFKKKKKKKIIKAILCIFSMRLLKYLKKKF
jgi:hypothetical protein